MEEFWNNLVVQAQTYGPNLIKAALVMIAFIIAAMIVRWLVSAAIDKTGLAKRANTLKSADSKSLGASLSSAAFWIIILVGLMQALAIAGATQISDALNGVIAPIMAYGDNIIGAVLVFGIFLIVANVVKQALSAILVFADGLPEQLGLASGPVKVSGITATIASAFIVLIGAITAFDVLDMAAISDPANALLEDIVGILPNLLAAIVILGIFAIVARFVGSLIARVLPGMGLDGAVAELGILKGADSGLTASVIASRVAQFFIVLLGMIAALNALGINSLSYAMDVVLSMGTQIVFGAVIIFAGVFIARLVTSAMASTGSGATDVAANLVKWIIIILSVILGISRMGLDPTGGEFILNVAQYLVMGGAAAFAIAFGWGGKDWAARQLESWRASR
ncbi:mechanosensitive ion channel [Hyphomonas johnsonii]|uniref:Small-conductance mechanosensitive channel n=1 Tax=Hyphomonas johnsonii MHS-2 TaxID=1280950 RepID=A0A059FHJ5_9PROT|nr:mechanosensitive ion channel [Hyphomonas johnsonii]KCZ89978.1 hypothetical protein HJO_13551 [Hyphomonas johnsonii MHS-2]